MNKKFLGVIAASAVAGAFWACGDGEIFEPSLTERVFLDNPPSGVSICEASGGCDGAFVVETSSSEASSSSRAQGVSSSSNGGLSWATPKSSSSLVINSAASSSAAADPTAIGSCAPTMSTIKAGGTVGYKFTANLASGHSQTEFLTGAKYNWNFGTNATPSTATGMSATGITINKSGVLNASVEVTMSGQNYLVQCSPLQVNGVDITGCKCAAEATSVDYTSAVPNWSVTGCATATTTKVLTYSWDGGAMGSETTFEKAFDVAQAGWAPTLKVANDDNTVIDVTCPAVKTTKGAEYQITEQNTKIRLPAGESNVLIDLDANWHNGTTGTCTFRCDGANQQITITIGELTSKPDYSATINLPVTQTINKSSIVVGLDVAADCQVAY
ncbi:MAG: hypothetical protein MJZ05_05225 [Fibrobacter sp.]|nr:hypothetical protein [Fibrobacter sp.]